MSPDLYALYFKHRQTGELTRYKSREPGTRAEIEAAALQTRRAEALSNTADEWETVALPVGSETPNERVTDNRESFRRVWQRQHSATHFPQP